jgi:Lipocalin / cytosolic fatty-acid binding protein family
LKSFADLYKNNADYKILATDYTTFAVVYVCEDFTYNFAHSKYVWILSRTRSPPTVAIDAAKAVLTKNGISLTWLLDTDNTNCPN